MTGGAWGVLGLGGAAAIAGAAVLGRLTRQRASVMVDLLAVWSALLLGGGGLATAALAVQLGPAALGSLDRADPVVLQAAVVGTQAAGLAGCAWLFGRGAPVGWNGPGAADAVLGLVVGVGQLGVAALAAVLQEAVGLPPVRQGFAQAALGASGVERAVLLGLLVVVPPCSEELLLRGHLHGAVARAWSPRVATALGGVVFGLLHAGDPGVVPALTVFGWMLGALRNRTGGVFAGMVAHLLVNATGVGMLVAAG